MCPAQPGARQRVGRPIRALRRRLDLRTARKPQPQHPRHLVEGLSGRIVAGAAQCPVPARRIDKNQFGVPTGHDQRHRRQRRPRVHVQPRRRNVTLQVVDRNQRNVQPKRQSASEFQTDQQRARQARPHGHRHRADLAHSHSGLVQCGPAHAVDGLGVYARRDFGHDPAVRRMRSDLRLAHRGRRLATVAQNRHRRVVTGRFDSQQPRRHPAGHSREVHVSRRRRPASPASIRSAKLQLFNASLRMISASSKSSL